MATLNDISKLKEAISSDLRKAHHFVSVAQNALNRGKIELTQDQLKHLNTLLSTLLGYPK